MTRRYTQHELHVIKTMLHKKHSFAEIADKTGRSAEGVRKKCSKFGWRSNAIRGRKSDAADGLQCIGMITIRLPQELHERLAKHCECNRVSISKFVAGLIEGKVQTCQSE